MSGTPQPPSPPEQPERRSFMMILTGLLGATAAAVFSVPFAGYLLGGALRKRPIHWVSLGPVTNFPVNETRMATFQSPIRQPWDGMAADTGVWVRSLGKDEQQTDQFWVFAVNCTHLGCPVTWFPQSGLFMCPCHGGVYYENGDRASGPPPRGLYKCVWRVVDGNLEIQAPHMPTLQDTLDKPAKLIEIGLERCRPRDQA